MATVVYSFGFMHHPDLAKPDPARLVLDVRHFRNPFHNPKFHGLGGDDPRVQTDIERTIGFTGKVALLTNRARSFPGPVYLGCTGGVHRSVALALRIGRELGIPIRHLDYTPKGRL